MKNKIEKELERKEFENEIAKDLNLEYSKLDAHKRMHEGKNKYAVTATYFFGTLVICYFFFFIARFIFNVLFGQVIGFFGIDLSYFAIPFHAAFFIIATVSAIKKRSVLDDIINRFL